MTENTEGSAGGPRAPTNDCLGIYLDEIRRIPLIDRAEEARLARAIRAGDRGALQQLVEANLRFVVSVSKQYRDRGVPLPDLINEGNVALIRAAEAFDETRGASFATYAGWWIRRSIRRVLAEQGRVVRVPIKRAEAVHRVARRRSELAVDLGREPTSRELAEDMGLSMGEVERTVVAGACDHSLDEPICPRRRIPLSESLPARSPVPGGDLLASVRADRVEGAVRALGRREAEVLRLYFGLGGEPPASLDDVGAAMGISGERARQIKEKALLRLRRSPRAGRLRELR